MYWLPVKVYYFWVHRVDRYFQPKLPKLEINKLHAIRNVENKFPKKCLLNLIKGGQCLKVSENHICNMTEHKSSTICQIMHIPAQVIFGLHESQQTSTSYLRCIKKKKFKKKCGSESSVLSAHKHLWPIRIRTMPWMQLSVEGWGGESSSGLVRTTSDR